MADVELKLRVRDGRKWTWDHVLATRHKAVLMIGGTPPSFNAASMGRGAHWSKVRRHKLDWERWLQLALLERRVPKDLLRVEAAAMLNFPTDRRRDEGNYRVLLEKALGDVLQAGGWLPDDTPDRYQFGAVQFNVPAEREETFVTVTYYRRENDAGPKIRHAVRG
ncbi:MAG TPA: hypothetical protein VGK41_00260 [Solirubrobacterales bacterium]